MISNRTLVKIASLGGFVTAGVGYIFHYRIQHDIRNSESYKDVMNIFHAHKKAVSYLGEPITLGRIIHGNGQQTLGQKTKYKWFKVLLKGSNTKAKLYYEIMLLEHKIEDKYETISKIEITFDNIPGKTFVIKDCEIK